jgi:hypothetical protein
LDSIARRLHSMSRATGDVSIASRRLPGSFSRRLLSACRVRHADPGVPTGPDTEVRAAPALEPRPASPEVLDRACNTPAADEPLGN